MSQELRPETIPPPTQPERPDREAKPMVGITYWIRCQGYRTRAVYTSSGKWLMIHNGKEVENVLGFFS